MADDGLGDAQVSCFVKLPLTWWQEAVDAERATIEQVVKHQVVAYAARCGG